MTCNDCIHRSVCYRFVIYEVDSKYAAKCGDFEASDSEIKKIKELTEKVDKLKAELDYAKFRCALPSIMDMMSQQRK